MEEGLTFIQLIDESDITPREQKQKLTEIYLTELQGQATQSSMY